jgi:hypothetical protein
MTVPDLRSQILLRSEQSAGHVSVIENVVAPRAKGPYLHKHDFDEAFYMIEAARPSSTSCISNETSISAASTAHLLSAEGRAREFPEVPKARDHPRSSAGA